ncbi:hypothetical protein CEUSTIGMA_g1936.t1 [Chlamydomonas eustigma]|uniref:Uncharacterized protein n=1 Tax=Chlamydomonas eustigma TaxID=1157962 RepID=A0A250WUI4_9CHLO|nr:hypothetical protein CEUSTIGMA_g1936.t1 [Chlamydomonas eustigma]|eukprot:GAX74487.1 hypothetical protein CEUSTIGMA_g1936.t1 [Chlamydomonas eustigma]
MSFIFELLQHTWSKTIKDADKEDLKNWQGFLESAEKDRERDRIIAWKDRTTPDNFAVNSEEPEYYRRTAGFLWRIKDATGTHKARNHQYLYNLEVFGHKQYTRRDPAAIAAAQAEVEARVSKGELGPLSPLA